MLERASGLVEGLVVHTERLRENLERTGELYYSEALMLALVEKGLGRQKAYEMVQANAMKAFAGEGGFRELVRGDADIGRYLSPSDVDACFDLEHALRWAQPIVE